MKIYTKTGDAGETSLLGGERVRKDHHRIEAYGTIDELNSQIGVIRASWPGGPIDADLAAIQSDLFDIGALLASAAPNEKFRGVREERIEALELVIDRMEAELAPLKNFVLPGGSVEASATHVARTVCRRSERMVVALGEPGEDTSRATRYLNRLSDFLFVAARYANHAKGVEDVPWKAR
ncbi:MAG: cob(I)yrinic acid a,c-diamide adenosyltransferase [Thermoanaerobaculia bacterium]|jgi:cob(I)alamin adenosyltransferase